MTKTYELVFADAEDIAEQMNELYQGLEENNSRRYWGYSSRSRQTDDKTRFVPERRSNSVIAIARPTEFPRIDKLVEQLDTPIDQEQVKPRIYKLQFVDANEVTEVLNKVFGGEDTESSGGYYDYWYGGNDDDKSEVGRLYGKVSFATLSTTNAIIVTTNNSENFKIIGDFIQELDQISPDAANTIVINLQNAQAAELAGRLNALYAGDGARKAPRQRNQQGNQQQEEEEADDDVYYGWLFGTPRDKDDKRVISNLIGQVRVVPDIRTNSLIVTTAPQNFPLLRELIEELDSESPKVLVQVRLIEVTTTKARRIGTRYGPDSSVFENEDLDNGVRSNFGFSFADVRRNGTIQLSSGIDLSAVVQFLQRRANTRILSDTTMAMNNNIPANVFVGAQIPFITNSQTTAEGGVVQSFDYRDAGTTLKITPNINKLDKVEMKIELEASQIRAGEVLFGGQILDTRQFNTDIAVGSGDTIVIGGIMRESDAESTRGFPILEKIPVANLVFRKKNKKREITELIAFITPTVMRDKESETAATNKAVEQMENINAWRPLNEPVIDSAPKPEKKPKRGMRSGRR
jgi:general secretion pathway protein D